MMFPAHKLKEAKLPNIEILGSGRIDERESSFPMAVQLPNDDLLCSFGVGGGPSASGGSDWARSTDGGESWNVEGTILDVTTDPDTTNFLKLTISPDGGTVYAYGQRSYRKVGEAKHCDEPVFCTSTDGGHTWSEPSVIPMPSVPLEISHGLLATSSGRLLAPAALFPPGRLGERVLVAVSDDGGKTWPSHSVMFQDPNDELGYLEQKLAEIEQGRLIATCWTATLDGVLDREDSFTLSNDDGSTWSAPAPTGIMGQTMTPIPLGGDRLLVLYNKRYGEQGIMMNLVTFTESKWEVHFEGTMFDGQATRSRDDVDQGQGEWNEFQFGFPTAIKLQDGTYLATHWSRESGHFGIRWTRLRVDF